MKHMKRWILLIVLALAVLTALNAKNLVKLYRNLTCDSKDLTAAEAMVKEYAEEHGLTYGDYPESLIALLERNPETETFVLEYPLWSEQEWDLSEYENCETVPLFIQWDQRWGYETYGSDCIGITGCGPTCLAMVGYYLTGEDRFNPADMADFSRKNRYYSYGNGTSWTLISEGAEKLGLKVEELPLVEKKISDSLAAGKPVILAVGPGDFTTTGHYIVLTAVVDGLFQINDPNSYANSERLWSYEELEPQIRNIWSVEKG